MHVPGMFHGKSLFSMPFFVIFLPGRCGAACHFLHPVYRPGRALDAGFIHRRLAFMTKSPTDLETGMDVVYLALCALFALAVAGLLSGCRKLETRR